MRQTIQNGPSSPEEQEPKQDPDKTKHSKRALKRGRWELCKRINQHFDAAELFVTRTEMLLSKSTPTAIHLFLFVHLIIDLIVVLIVVCKHLS